MEAMPPRATTTQQASPPRATVPTTAAGATPTAIPSAAPPSHRDAPLQAARPSSGQAAELDPNGDEVKHRVTRSNAGPVAVVCMALWFAVCACV